MKKIQKKLFFNKFKIDSVKMTHLHKLSFFGIFTSSSDSKVILKAHSNSVFEFKLNSPKKLNSLDPEMCQIMLPMLKKWFKEPKQAPRVLIMSGEGGKAFCAGGNLPILYNLHIDPKSDKTIKRTFFENWYLLDYSLSLMKPFQISIWNGICMGGGVGLTWHSPVRIATEASIYAMPETAIGFFCDVGGSYFLSHINRTDPSVGLYLGITGH